MYTTCKNSNLYQVNSINKSIVTEHSVYLKSVYINIGKFNIWKI